MEEEVKIVVVGDGAVGKSCLLVSYAQNRFPEEYIPTVFDNYVANVMYKSRVISIGLWDTAGQEDYDKLRPLSYPETDCFVLCYSVVNPTSLYNLEHKWLPEVRQYCPGTPIVVVGTKIDLREDPKTLRKLEARGEQPVKREEVASLVKRLGVYTQVECSARLQKGVYEVFEQCLNSKFEPITPTAPIKKKKCIIM
ncbi:Rac1 [Acrasis kona]|uniref:Rac1 n=1 Tax=Acrasis kona TaxID=1008807 RepID=A0AAW2YSV1_9EUKA